MDQMYSDPVFGGAALAPHSPHADDVRTAMGYTRGYAERMDLINMTPQGSLSPIGNDDGYVLGRGGRGISGLPASPRRLHCKFGG